MTVDNTSPQITEKAKINSEKAIAYRSFKIVLPIYILQHSIGDGKVNSEIMN